MVAQDQRVFPRGNPFRMIKVTHRCFRALVMWKKPWFLSQGPVLGASCRCKMLTTDASLTGWGAILEGHLSQGLWKDQHLSWHINRLEMLAVFLALKNFLAELRGHHVLVHSDWRAKSSCVRAAYILGADNIGADILSRWAEAQGMEAPPRGGGADMEGVWPGTRGSVCVSRDVSLSTLVLPHASSSTRTGCDGADVAEASYLCISPDRSAPGSPEKSSPRPGSTTFHCPAVASRVWFADIISLLDVPPLELPVRKDLLSQAGGSIFHPQPELWKLWAWPLMGPSS